MYQTRIAVTTPDDSEQIWRYVDFAAFLAIISTASLLFRRCDKFTDKWDSRYSYLPSLLKREFESEQQRVLAIRGYLEQQEDFRNTTFANCWHRSKDESAAMWELYTARGSGIAIRSTIGRLKRALDACALPVFIGEVEYGNFQDDSRMTKDPGIKTFFMKRLAYQYELEVRAVILGNLRPERKLSPNEVDIDTEQGVYKCAVHLEKLIESVVVSPNIHAEVVGMIKKLLENFGFPDIPVSHSELAEDPITLEFWDKNEPRAYRLPVRGDHDTINRLLHICETHHSSQPTKETSVLREMITIAARKAGFYGEHVYIPPDPVR